jgi:hypothetical protein
MKFSEIKKNACPPFEEEDRELLLLFSFFLHKAPTIDSNLALKSYKDSIKWNNYIRNWKESTYKFYASKFPKDNVLKHYKLVETANISNKYRTFICVKKDKGESDYECFVRHIRNSIAHGYVYINKQQNRVYILLEDYNSNKNKQAIILVSKSDLIKLKKEIEKEI